LRHGDRPELVVSFLSRVDLCHGRRDDASHGGDPQPQPMAAVYGPRPHWQAYNSPSVGRPSAMSGLSSMNNGRTPRLSAAARCLAGWLAG
jgi:hypothetical protein